MLHACRVLRLALETRHEFARSPGPRRKQLDRDLAVERNLQRAVDHAHAALTKVLQQLVVAEMALRGIRKIQFQRFGRHQCEMPRLGEIGGAREAAEGKFRQAARVGQGRVVRPLAFVMRRQPCFHPQCPRSSATSNACCSAANSSADVTVSASSSRTSSRNRCRRRFNAITSASGRIDSLWPSSSY